MSKSSELIVIRHGETEWNKIGKQQGQQNSPLTEEGRRQAAVAGAVLKNEGAELIYSSDLGRALESAEIIQEQTGLPIKTHKDLRERHLGILQELTIKEFAQKFPREYEKFRGNDPLYVIPGGESAQERYDRGIRAFNEIEQQNRGKKIIVVTHGGILESFFRFVIGFPPERQRTFSLYNGSLNRFSCRVGVWMLLSWGDISYLKGLNVPDDF